jgi:hypothetical protein
LEVSESISPATSPERRRYVDIALRLLGVAKRGANTNAFLHNEHNEADGGGKPPTIDRLGVGGEEQLS